MGLHRLSNHARRRRRAAEMRAVVEFRQRRRRRRTQIVAPGAGERTGFSDVPGPVPTPTVRQRCCSPQPAGTRAGLPIFLSTTSPMPASGNAERRRRTATPLTIWCRCQRTACVRHTTPIPKAPSDLGKRPADGRCRPFTAVEGSRRDGRRKRFWRGNFCSLRICAGQPGLPRFRRSCAKRTGNCGGGTNTRQHPDYGDYFAEQSRFKSKTSTIAWTTSCRRRRLIPCAR